MYECSKININELVYLAWGGAGEEVYLQSTRTSILLRSHKPHVLCTWQWRSQCSE